MNPKAIWVDAETHARVKIAAAKERKTLDDYLVGLLEREENR